MADSSPSAEPMPAELTPAERWQRVEGLFNSAVELPVGERSAFLDAACGDDLGLRQEVDELVKCDSEDCGSEDGDFIADAVKAGEELLAEQGLALPPRFGKYEVEARLGEGGFGVVYRGRDPLLQRPVAIKACTSTDEDFRRRFYREARIAAGLRHPNITTVHELGVEEGVPFLVQELLAGEDLRQIVQERRSIPLSTSIGYLVEIARGLEHAHDAGVLHRDIKPANVRILPDGSVKLMDFGIAKLLGADTGLTVTGMTLGTVGYLAPEQLRSEDLDERADIFAFGVLAYELLSGQRPFVGDDFSQVSYQLLYVDPPPLAKAWPQCPTGLADLVHRCLAKQKVERPGSMMPLRRELEAMVGALSGSDFVVERAALSSAAASGQWSKPWQTRHWIGGVGVLAAVALFVLWIGQEVPGTSDLARSEVPGTSIQEATQEVPGTRQEVPGTSIRAPQEVPGTSDLAGSEVPATSDSARSEVPGTSTHASIQEVPGTTDDASQEVPGTRPDAAAEVPGTSIQASIQEVPGTLDDAIAEASQKVPGTSENTPADSTPADDILADSPATTLPPPADDPSEVPELSVMQPGDMITAEGPGVTVPQVLQRPTPAYPRRARRRGIEGQVVVKVLVGEDGKVLQVIAPGSDEHGFLASARKAAQRAVFEPAKRDGVVGRMWINLPFDFRLD